MNTISWDDKDMRWQKVVVVDELTRLSYAFCIIFVLFAVLGKILVVPIAGISVIVLFFYAASVFIILFQRWHGHEYTVTPEAFVIVRKNGKHEVITAGEILTGAGFGRGKPPSARTGTRAKTFKAYDEFILLSIVKNMEQFDVYVGRDTKQWDMLSNLLKLT